MTLGREARASVFAETTYVEEINKLEKLRAPKKVHSRKHGRCASVVLKCSYASMDQIEKRALTLLSAGNRDWGHIFG